MCTHMSVPLSLSIMMMVMVMVMVTMAMVLKDPSPNAAVLAFYRCPTAALPASFVCTTTANDSRTTDIYHCERFVNTVKPGITQCEGVFITRHYNAMGL
jgi:hypothetical protein